MTRIMALDVGRRRIGIALSDPLGLTAQAREVWQCRGREEDIEHIRTLCRREGVREIVVGNPLRTDGTAGPESRYVTAFAEALRRACPDCQVHLWDERFTTHEAGRLLAEQGVRGRRRRQVVDMTAAAIILESFMARRRNA